MVQIVNFRARAFPLGGEIDLNWGYDGEFPEGAIVLIFKSKEEFKNILIEEYLSEKQDTSSLKDKGIQIFPENNPHMSQAFDYDVIPKQQYFYKIVIVKYTETGKDKDDKPIFSYERSEIREVQQIGKVFDAGIEVVPAKALVFEVMEKLTDVISNRSDGAKIDVYEHFPTVDPEGVFFTVTRASVDTAARFWGNILADKIDSYRKGLIEMETINVTWWVINQPKIRDKITDVIRGLRFLIQRYCRFKYASGVIDVQIGMLADESYPEEGYRYHTAGMLVTFFIESSVEYAKQAPIAKEFLLKLEYDVDKKLNEKNTIVFEVEGN